MRKSRGSPPVQTLTSSSQHSRPGHQPRGSQMTTQREVTGQGGGLVPAQAAPLPSPCLSLYVAPHQPKTRGCWVLPSGERGLVVPAACPCIPASPCPHIPATPCPRLPLQEGFTASGPHRQTRLRPHRGWAPAPCFCPGLSRTWKESHTFGGWGGCATNGRPRRGK